jgi:hypothetical protein
MEYIYSSVDYQHSSNICIWSIYIHQLIWYSRNCGSYYDFHESGLLVTNKLLNQWFLVVKFESSLVGIPLPNVCVTKHNGYVPFVVINISGPFPHSWLITGFLTRLTCHFWIRNCLPFWITQVHCRIVVGFVL